MTGVGKFIKDAWVEILAVALLVIAGALFLSADKIVDNYVHSHGGADVGAGALGVWFIVMGLALLCVFVGLSLFFVNTLVRRWPTAPLLLVAAVGVAALAISKPLDSIGYALGLGQTGDVISLVSLLLGAYLTPLAAVLLIRRRQVSRSRNLEEQPK
jgi:hypothetical protein